VPLLVAGGGGKKTDIVSPFSAKGEGRGELTKGPLSTKKRGGGRKVSVLKWGAEPYNQCERGAVPTSTIIFPKGGRGEK